MLVAGATGLLSIGGLVRIAGANPQPAATRAVIPTGVAAPGPAVAVTSARRLPVHRLDDLAPGRALPADALALTLDDGPHPVWTPRMLELLDRFGVRATFFVIGEQVRRDPGLVREVAARGHEIGNHTYHHDEALGHRNRRTITGDVDRTDDAIHAACGQVPRLFRAPGGDWTPRLLRVLTERALLPIGWDVDPRDWSRPGVAHIERTVSRARAHDIVLCHDGGGDRSQTHAALALVIPALQRRGLSFVRIPA